MKPVASFGIRHPDHLTSEQAQKVDALLAIVQPVVFPRGHWAIEDCLATNEVETVFPEVRQTLGFIPGHPVFIVSTKSVIACTCRSAASR